MKLMYNMYYFVYLIDIYIYILLNYCRTVNYIVNYKIYSIFLNEKKKWFDWIPL